MHHLWGILIVLLALCGPLVPRVGAGQDASIAASPFHTCALTRDGAVSCWGYNGFGQLGDGTSQTRLTPVSVSGLGNRVVSMAAELHHTCAVTSDGAAWCWGENGQGQLGNGTTTGSLTPVAVSGLDAGVIAMDTGGFHTCALTSTGAVWCWGRGALGTGSLTPEPVSGLGSGVVALAAGFSHTCALTTVGVVWCWGFNFDGQLGDGTTTDRPTPVPVSGLGSDVVALGDGARCAIKSGGAVWCWGHNVNGEVGDGTMQTRLTPVPVNGLGSDAVAVAGAGHTCALAGAGAVWCWGRNDHGQVGDGSTTNRLTPTPVTGMGGDVVAVATGGFHTCAMTTAGAVSCWGFNEFGQLGDGTVREWLTPAPVSGPPDELGRYFAEGGNDEALGLRTRFALVNPHDVETSVTLEFLTASGTPITLGPLGLGAHKRQTVDTWVDVPGLANTRFSTLVRASGPSVVADRTMWWDGRGTGGHAETGTPRPASTWYLAEGATIDRFELSYLIHNPNAAPATVTVRYLLRAGTPVEKIYEVPGQGRAVIPVNFESAQGISLDNQELSAVLMTGVSTPIIVERAMYLTGPGQVFSGGHQSAGVTSPATQWFFAEGATGDFFDLFLLVTNPGRRDALVEATYLLPDGTALVKSYTVAANSRFNIWVDYEDARLANTAVSVEIRSVNHLPIIVERAMWWPVSPAAWYEAHNSPGATETGTRWVLAEGEVDATRNLETYTLIANTSATPAAVRVTLLFEDGGTAERTYAGIPARSRFNVPVGVDFPEAAGQRFGTIIESLGATPAQIVVERAMYWNAGGRTWAVGTNALGTKLR